MLKEKSYDFKSIATLRKFSIFNVFGQHRADQDYLFSKSRKQMNNHNILVQQKLTDENRERIYQKYLQSRVAGPIFSDFYGRY